jgi:hypothetical protein
MPAFIESGVVVIQRKSPSPDSRDRLGCKWTKGAATSTTDFGDPPSDGYLLCVYDAGAIVLTAPVAGSCTTKPCWVSKTTGFVFHDKSLQPSSVQTLKLAAGADGKASVVFKGNGASLMEPDPSGLTSPIDVQLRKGSGPPCWGARFSSPFQKDVGGVLKDKSD